MATRDLILLPDLYVQRIIEIGIEKNKKRYVERGGGKWSVNVCVCLCVCVVG
jgi:hypothetical protein